MNIKFIQMICLPLKETIDLVNMIIVVRSILSKGQQILSTDFLRQMFVSIKKVRI